MPRFRNLGDKTKCHAFALNGRRRAGQFRIQPGKFVSKGVVAPQPQSVIRYCLSDSGKLILISLDREGWSLEIPMSDVPAAVIMYVPPFRFIQGRLVTVCAITILISWRVFEAKTQQVSQDAIQYSIRVQTV